MNWKLLQSYRRLLIMMLGLGYLKDRFQWGSWWFSFFLSAIFNYGFHFKRHTAQAHVYTDLLHHNDLTDDFTSQLSAQGKNKQNKMKEK